MPAYGYNTQLLMHVIHQYIQGGCILIAKCVKRLAKYVLEGFTLLHIIYFERGSSPLMHSCSIAYFVHTSFMNIQKYQMQV